MNIGTWILSGAAPTAITAGLLLRRRGWLSWLGEGFGFSSGVFGMGLATYTGVLVGNTAIPVWQSSRRILPLLFGASAVASAGSFLELLSESPREQRITRTFGALGRAAELTAAVAMEKCVSRVPQVARPLRQGTSGLLWRASTVLTGASLLVLLLPGTSRKKRVIAGSLGLAGSPALRRRPTLGRHSIHTAPCLPPIRSDLPAFRIRVGHRPARPPANAGPGNP